MRLLLLLLPLGATAAAAQESDRERLDFFEQKIRPILADRCYKCHSAESRPIKGGLLLDSRDAVLRGGEGGPAVVPGDPERSPLIRAIRYTDTEVQMPPKARLTPEQVADFERWVRMGAPAPAAKADTGPAKAPIDYAAARRFWSFRPVAAPPPPTVTSKNWPRTDIDRFILAKLEEQGRAPAADADRRTLLRRATFDLLGLPPTPEEVEQFVNDPSPEAFSRVVDRLLASPHYGERWGRHWLDVVRYADTAGDNADFPVPQAHKYRDYVIDSFNRDTPYDEFVREQVAGDLMDSAGEEERCRRIVATGFIAIARRFGLEPDAEIHLTIDDTIDTLGRSVLGMTLGCARCHDHKFDPVPTEDYYALYGVFKSSRYPFPGGERMKYQKDFVPLIPREKADEVLKPFEEKYAVLDAEVRALKESLAAAEKDAVKARLDELKKALGEASKKRAELVKRRPEIDDAYALAEGTPSNARVHLKGSPTSLGAEVPRRFLQVLGGQPLADAAGGSGRLGLARWLTDPANPLTARVMVNRIWQHHFGQGIVQTPSVFGKQGLPPTHPELLDHLASEFMKNGWSIKALHRRIMLSRTYQVSAAGDGFPRRRLDAESLRDAMLAVSGSLDRTPGGAHAFPPRDQRDFSQASPFYAVYETHRRSVYLMQQRLKKHPFLALFDGPDTNASTAARTQTLTPLQALFMMNSTFTREQAGKFAARIRREAGDDRARIDLAHRLAFGRPATTEEIEAGEAFLRGPGDGRWTGYARVLLCSNEFMFVD
jgi:hypothetical protein